MSDSARVRRRESIVYAEPILEIVRRDPKTLKAAERRVRKATAKQIALLGASYAAFGMVVPVLIDQDDVIISGHARVDAAIAQGLSFIPTIRIEHLSENQIRAFRIADNKIYEHGEWDEQNLKLEFRAILECDFDFTVELTGFNAAEIDQLSFGKSFEGFTDPTPIDPEVGPPVSQVGDVFRTEDGRYSVVCGDMLADGVCETVLQDRPADLVVCDLPFNLKSATIGGKGRRQHPDFEQGGGEMGREEFAAYLFATCARLVAVSRDGTLSYLFQHWRYQAEMTAAGRSAYSQQLAFCVWAKPNAGMGGLYRSAHELVWVFKAGKAPHTDNVQLGKNGRNRTNVWTYPGLNGGAKGRSAALAAHPTVKNTALIADIILDASRPNEMVFDGFLGSGTTLIAAHQTGRKAAGVEISPTYVDLAVRRFQAATGLTMLHATSGKTFDALYERAKG